MNQYLKTIQDILQQKKELSEADKEALIKAITDADKQWSITDFKLDRTEKVKKTTAILLEETIEELEQKRKAVEAQNRELEIESSLERVRAVAMGMKKSDDLLSICEVLFKELQTLGFSHLRNTLINTFVDEQNYFIDYDFSDFAGGSSTRIPYSGHPVIEKYIKEARKKNDAFIEIAVTGKELEDWKEFRRANGETDDPRLDNIAALYYYNYSIGVAGIGISTFQPITQEKLEVLKRFRNVFDLAYKRYVDISNAEAQSKEARIEAALEKVRSRSLAVHQSDEFKEVISVVFEKLQELEIPVESASINIFIDGSKDTDVYACGHSENGLDIRKVRLRYFDHPIANDLYNVHKNGLDFFVGSYGIKEKNSYYEYQFKHGDLKELPSEIREKILQTEHYSLSMAPAKHSIIIINNFDGKLLSETEIDIVKRFARVFEQAYTRFLDLQKAEAQAREAQIEVAVERVRAQSMAMHQTTDLEKVNKELYNQLQWLKVDGLSGVSIYFLDKEGEVKAWDLSSPGNIGDPSSYTIKFSSKKYPILGELWQHYKKSGDYFTLDYPLEKLKAVIAEFREVNIIIGNAFEEAINSGNLTHQWNAFGRISNGVLGIDLMNPPSEDTKTIVLKMAGAFNLAYKRFLDLQKAEAQAREAQTEAALEKVRARTMAMQRSVELGKAAALMFQQVQSFGVSSFTCGFNIWETDDISITSYMAKPDGTFEVASGSRLPHTEHPHFMQSYEARKRGEEFFILEAGGKELEDTYRYMFGLPDFKKLFEDWKNSGFPVPAFQISHYVFFQQGYLLFITYEPVPEMWDIFKRFGKVFEQTYTRFLDLQKAEAQARDAKIEAALERTRTQSMLMQHSDELKDISKVFHQQILELHIETEFSYLWLPDEPNKKHLFWATWAEDENNETSYFSKAVNYDLDKTEPATATCFSDWESGVPVHVYTLNPAEVVTYFESWKELLSGARKLKPEFFPEGIYYAEAFMKYGCFGIMIHRKITGEEQEILRRFAIEFERTYTRFLDLQKAEAQAREARIEAALEKVRSRTMGMQNSNELQDTALLLLQQILALGVSQFGCGFNIWDDDRKAFTAWMGGGLGENTLVPPFKVSSSEDVFLLIHEAAERGESLFVREQGGEELETHYRYMNSMPLWKEIMEGITLPTFQVIHCAFFSQGFLIFISPEPIPEAHDIFKRFAKVFEQTYTRFLDLQKAEAQAREARIEAALEKVRSRTMAMQRSDELANVATVLFQQVKALGVPQWTCGFSIFEIDDKEFTWYPGSADGDILAPVKIPLTEHPVFISFNESRKRGDELFVYEKAGEFQAGHYRYMQSLPGVGEMLQRMLDAGLSFPTFQIDHLANFSHGSLVFITYEPVPEMHHVFKRFAKVFEQTYTRFLDLKNAEAQALEAIKRASVDRVRAEIASMRTTSDLERIQPLIWNELKTLDVPFIRCGVFIMDEEKQEVQTMLSTPGGKAIATLHVPFEFDLSIITNGVKYWRKKKVYTEHWDAAAFTQVWIKLSSLRATSMDSTQTEHPPESLHLHMLPFLQGMLYVGSEAPLNDEQLQLVQNLADAFSTAYARYEDFNKLEAAKKQVDNTLNELQVTQRQLIQSEKMASLGELTAGIAHEIQNPLNFVNNFSDVSNELLDEMETELEKGNKEAAIAIAGDVKQNLEKILHHGKRADAIVKGMLQHSRSSSGQKEATDINALCDEYLRLAYHGLRAKDKSFNAKVETGFDNSVGKLNIIPQDIGRVLVNLINNAFYAVNEKKKQGPNNYEPLVSVTTKKTGDKAEIRIRDNGTGIPQKVMEKIFQPFFTTKPAGQGTGLGLSLAYDIITKGHGGGLKVETKEGAETEFIIELPAG